jgi:hypothetical protein
MTMACCILLAALFRSLRARLTGRGTTSINELVIEAERQRDERRAERDRAGSA